MLAGCGRLGFDAGDPSAPADGAPDAELTTAIELTVQYGAGTPEPAAAVADASVVLDDGTILRTDATGSVLIPAPVARTFHVVYDSRLPPLDVSPFRVTTLYDVEPGTRVKLGARGIETATGGKITLTAPADPNAIDYQLWGPLRCGPPFDNGNPMPSFSYSFRSSCEGTGTRMFMLSNAAGGAQSLNATPEFLFAADGTVAFGAWVPVTFGGAIARNLPEFATQAIMRLIHVAGPDVYELAVALGFPNAGVFGLSAPAPLATNYVSLRLTGSAAFNNVTLFGPVNEVAEFDASDSLPLMGPTAVNPTTRRVAWGDPATAVLVRASVTIQDETNVVWTIYTPPSRREAIFPDLPGDLASLVPGPSALWDGFATAIGTREESASQLLKFVDLEFDDWRNFRSYPETTKFLSTAIVPP